MTTKEKKDYILSECYARHDTCVGCPLAGPSIDCNVETMSDEDADRYYDMFISREDTWSKYIAYLKEWADSHAAPEFRSCSPACYEEWLDMEFSEKE